MGIFTGLLEKLYRVAAKYRCASIVVGAATLVPLSLGVSEPALAQAQVVCEELGIGSGTFTCPANNYSNNFNFNGNNTPLNVTLQSPDFSVVSPGGNAVNLATARALRNSVVRPL